jgi:hypothetical protein
MASHRRCQRPSPIGAAKAVAGLRETSVPQTPKINWYVRSIDVIDDKTL